MDSLSYILVNKVKVPTALWAVPYTETFALGCVQHMGATLKMQNIPMSLCTDIPMTKSFCTS